MSPRRRWMAYIAILGLGLLWIYLNPGEATGSPDDTLAAPQQGFLAPDFDLRSLSGETIRLSDLRGQAVLINLWATWCPPCREEMPAIEKAYHEYRDQGFVVLGINMTHQDNPASIGPFVKEQGLTFPILLDERGDTAQDYEMRSLPTSYFVRRDGIINEVVIGGPMSEALLRTRIEAILK